MTTLIVYPPRVRSSSGALVPLVVEDEAGNTIPAEGKTVEYTQYVRDQITRGVVLTFNPEDE